MRSWLPVLTFHSIDDYGAVISFPSKVFRNGIEALTANGVQTIDLIAAVDMVRRGEGFPERCVVITFDDGYSSVYREALPVLQRTGMMATLFLTVGAHRDSASGRAEAYNGREMLSWTEIREMHASGSFKFGAHTLTHPDLTLSTAERVEAELRDSKTIIEDALGGPVTCFAYPFGRYDERSRAIAARHFECACSDRLGLVTARSDVFALERVDAYYLRSERLLNLLVGRSFRHYVWARGVPRRIKRAFADRARQRDAT